MCIFLGDKHDMKSNQIELQYMFSCSYDYEFWPFFNFYGLMALLLSLKFITIGLPYLSRLVHKLCKGYFSIWCGKKNSTSQEMIGNMEANKQKVMTHHHHLPSVKDKFMISLW